MRGAARVGGKSFKMPQDTRAPDDGFNPFESLVPIGDLPVAPVLEPINDEWSISNFNEPVDAKDCSKYPASPYCENEWIDPFGSPFGVTPEIKTNACETCLYVYPIVMWLKLQPTIICKRDPNCELPGPEDNPPPSFPLPDMPKFAEQAPNRWVSISCAFERNRIIRNTNRWNQQVSAVAGETTRVVNGQTGNLMITRQWSGTFPSSAFTIASIEEGSPAFGVNFTSNYIFREATLTFPATGIDEEIILYIRADLEYVSGINFSPCPDAGAYPTPPPPLPLIPETRKKRGKDMCCNDCKDSKDNTDRLLKEMKEIKKVLGSGKLEKAFNAAVGIGDDSITTIVNLIAKRIGTSSYPVEVPESLLQGTGDKVKKLESNAEFLHWLTYQFDGLVGQFPIDVEVKDIDPLKEGDQNKTIQLPNIAEAIAEIYGLVIKSSVNQEVELNMLLRLAAEAIATKNAAVVTQDYARANALFLGYKANYKPRELQYNFDFTNANLDPKSKEPIVLEKLLRTVKGYVQGWQLEDKETVVGFLQKLMFSAGIIKAVFFRGKGQQKELQREINSMANDEKAQEAKFEAFIKQINDPNSQFNKDTQDKPEIKDETPPDSNRGTK